MIRSIHWCEKIHRLGHHHEYIRSTSFPFTFHLHKSPHPHRHQIRLPVSLLLPVFKGTTIMQLSYHVASLLAFGGIIASLPGASRHNTSRTLVTSQIDSELYSIWKPRPQCSVTDMNLALMKTPQILPLQTARL